MATPNINTACSVLTLKYDGSGVISGTYLNCGDLTPITVSATGGTPNATYTTVNGVSASVALTAGSVVVGNQVGGYTDSYKTWTQFVKTSGY